MAITVACCILIVSRYVPSVLDEESAKRLVYRRSGDRCLRIDRRSGPVRNWSPTPVARPGRELLDERKFGDPMILEARACTNAKKYAREEGGNNRFQNHLTSLTRVKPGFVHAVALRATLFVINLLSRFWFNVGTLRRYPDNPLGPLGSHRRRPTVTVPRQLRGCLGQLPERVYRHDRGQGAERHLDEHFRRSRRQGRSMLQLSPNAVLFLEGGSGRAAVQGLRAGEPDRDDRMVQRLSDAERCEHQYEHRCSTILSEPLAACEIDAVVQNL